jgi:23S rRNA (uracil1939-C5)-methyltransferase
MEAWQSLPPGCERDCRGCRHRHLPHADSVAQKAGYLRRALAPWAAQIEDVRTAPAGQRLGYRDRVTLTAGFDAAAGWRFGMMRRDELIPIHDCPVHSPRVNRLVAVLRATLPGPDQFALAYLHVAGGQATLVVKQRHFDPESLNSLRVRLPGTGIDGLWVHCHPSAGRRLFARSGWHLAWGEATSSDAAGLVHGPAAFQQLLPDLHADSLQRAAAQLQPGPGVAVLDLYCGIGATLRLWTAAGAAALGIELAGGAVESAASNAPAAGLLRGTCEQRLPQAREWWRGHEGWRRVCYVNPPRSGLEQGTLEALTLELRPRSLAYLSCSAGTLARDIAAFVAADYVVRSLVPYDFFPGTHHVECLALLDCARG